MALTIAKLNKMTRCRSNSNAREVYVRHCTEEVVFRKGEGIGDICHLVHPDVTLVEFFS